MTVAVGRLSAGSFLSARRCILCKENRDIDGLHKLAIKRNFRNVSRLVRRKLRNAYLISRNLSSYTEFPFGFRVTLDSDSIVDRRPFDQSSRVTMDSQGTLLYRVAIDNNGTVIEITFVRDKRFPSVVDDSLKAKQRKRKKKEYCEPTSNWCGWSKLTMTLVYYTRTCNW